MICTRARLTGSHTLLGRSLGVLVALATALGVAAAPARSVEPAPARLVTVRLPASVPIGGTYLARIHVRGPAATFVRFTLHAPVTNVVDLARGRAPDVPAGDLGSVVGPPINIALEDLDHRPSGDLILRIPMQAPGETTSREAIQATEAGVWPAELTLFGDRGPLDRKVTWLVATDGPTPVPLRVAWVWTLRSTPLRDSNRSPDARVLGAIQPGGELDTLTRAIGSMSALPTTLRATPELVESWAALAADQPALRPGLARLRRAIPGLQLLSEPYVALDRSAVEHDGLGDRMSAELLAGSRALEATFGARLDPRTAFVDRPDRATLDRLRASFTDRVVVRPEALDAIDSTLRYQPFAIAGTNLTGLQTDDDLFALLSGPDDAAVRAQRLIAALSVLAFQSPEDPRGVVLAPGDHATSPLLVRRLAEGFANNPLLQPTTLNGLFATLPMALDLNGEPVEREPVLAPSGGVAVTPSDMAAGDLDRDSLARLVGDGDRRVADADRTLLLVLASGLERSETSSALAGIPASARAFLSQVIAQSRTVTLAARSAQIPLSFINGTGRAVRIRVTLATDKLAAPGNRRARISKIIDLPARPPNTTTLLAAEARVAGRFEVPVIVTSADGRVPGREATITVNSTVFGAFGSWLTIGALAFLVLWWGHHIWRRRRAVVDAS